MLQKIIVFLTLDESDTNLILCGVHLATVFRKELCLFFRTTGAYQADITDQKLKNYRQALHDDFPQLPVSILVGSFKGEKFAATLADEHEAILLVTGALMFKKLSQPLQSSPIPFLFINEYTTVNPDFSKIFYPVDLRKQNRDAMKWIVYFGKHNSSEIFVIGANDKSKSNRQMVAGHLSALKKILVKNGIKHKIYRGYRSSLGIHNEGFEAASKAGGGMLVLLGSSVITLLDLLLGLPEEKIIRHSGNLPVLIVNPRRETYLVCE